MRVRIFQVGPIVGATTPRSVRIFGRGEYALESGQPKWAHAAVRVRRKGRSGFFSPKFFKLNPNFDMSAVMVWEGLAADADYEYQAGYFYMDEDSARINIDSSLDWSGIKIHEFRTASNDDKATRTIVMGSCRYLLRIFDCELYDDRGDKTFRSIMDQHLAPRRRINALIMAGDQIYADDLGPFSADRKLSDYLKRYRAVFSQKHIRQLMAQVPTYMTLDDHEIEDNWPAKARSRDHATKFPSAIQAYKIYQASHSPLHPLQNGRIADVPDKRLWYTHNDGCCDFFFTDTRTERDLRRNQREIMSRSQLSELLAWLANDSLRVKVMVTSVPFWESDGRDTWNGFREQRDHILDYIKTKNIRRVLILSGDVHSSMSSELHLDSDRNFKIISVVSSAFFWPVGHPKLRQFRLSGPLDGNTKHNFQIQNASPLCSTDNFTRLRIDPSQVQVEVFDRKGMLLSSRNHLFPTAD